MCSLLLQIRGSGLNSRQKRTIQIPDTKQVQFSNGCVLWYVRKRNMLVLFWQYEWFEFQAKLSIQKLDKESLDFKWWHLGTSIWIATVIFSSKKQRVFLSGKAKNNGNEDCYQEGSGPRQI